MGDTPITLTATSSSGLPVRLEVVSGSGRLNGNALEILGGGQIGIRAMQDGDGRYNAAVSVTRNLEVKLRPQIVQTGKGTVMREPAVETISYGSSLSLTAIPESGFLFDGWRGGVVSKGNPLSVVVTNNLRIEAVFTRQWVLTLSNTAGGWVISEPAPSAAKNGGNVTVTAVPTNGYGFRGWVGTFVTNSNPLEFVLSTNVNLAADFRRMFSVTVVISDGGTTTVTPKISQSLDGDPLNIAAAASEGYRFDGWEGKLAGLSATATLILTNDVMVQARFKKLQRLVLDQTGEGQVTVSDGVYYDIGETVTVQAQAAKGWMFSGWQGSVIGNENPVKLVMGTNTGVKAIFKQLFTLTAGASVGGVVEVAPAQSEYADGTVVTLRAKADQNKRFDHWEGNVKGTNSPVTVVLTNHAVVAAVFVPVYRLLALSDQNLALGFRLRAEGEVGGKYLIETSVGLETWTPLATITNQTGGVEHLDSQASFLSRRFYRIRPAQ